MRQRNAPHVALPLTDMEERKHTQHCVGVCEAEVEPWMITDLSDVGSQVAMGKDDALGKSSCAR